jgi:membrane protein required for beta-lactamase induction
MNNDEAMSKLWLKMGEEKHLIWEVRTALLLAAVVSYFTMSFWITFLIGLALVTFIVTVKKTEHPESPNAQDARSS